MRFNSGLKGLKEAEVKSVVAGFRKKKILFISIDFLSH